MTIKRSKSVRVGIVAGEFNEEIATRMVEAAQDEVALHGARIETVVRVPGVYEIPLAAQMMLKEPVVDMIVALGFIEKGETLHGAVMGQVVHTTLVSLELAHEKPVGMGIIGPGATLAQAKTRADHYARQAVRAALAVRSTLVTEL